MFICYITPWQWGVKEVNSIVSLGLVASLLTQRRKVGLEFGTVENMGVTLVQTLQAGPQSLSAICLRQQQGHVKPPGGTWWWIKNSDYAEVLTVGFHFRLWLEVKKKLTVSSFYLDS